MDSLEVTDAQAAEVATAPRVTLADIEAKIEHTQFMLWSEILTICIVQMKNGFFVVGKSAPADAQNFDADLGKKFAREDCIRQLWQLEGYSLRNKLSEA